jgi:hypothetical protein
MLDADSSPDSGLAIRRAKDVSYNILNNNATCKPYKPVTNTTRARDYRDTIRVSYFYYFYPNTR